jgi:hypothetical protein
MRPAQRGPINLQQSGHRQKLVLDLDGQSVELRVEVIVVADRPSHAFI